METWKQRTTIATKEQKISNATNGSSSQRENTANPEAGFIWFEQLCIRVHQKWINDPSPPKPKRGKVGTKTTKIVFIWKTVCNFNGFTSNQVKLWLTISFLHIFRNTRSY